MTPPYLTDDELVELHELIQQNSGQGIGLSRAQCDRLDLLTDGDEPNSYGPLLATIAHDRDLLLTAQYEIDRTAGLLKKSEAALAVVTEAADPFIRVYELAMACPRQTPQPYDDSAPLRDMFPGVWPEWGDLRKLCEALSNPQAAATALLARLEKAEWEREELCRERDALLRMNEGQVQWKREAEAQVEEWKGSFDKAEANYGRALEQVSRLEKTQLPAGCVAVCSKMGIPAGRVCTPITSMVGDACVVLCGEADCPLRTPKAATSEKGNG